MHLLEKFRASLRRKSSKIDLTLSEQIEDLLNQSNRFVNDHRLLILRLVYEYRSRHFDEMNESKRLEFERSMLRSLLAITSYLPPKSHSIFSRSATFYQSLPTATSTQKLKRKNP